MKILALLMCPAWSASWRTPMCLQLTWSDIPSFFVVCSIHYSAHGEGMTLVQLNGLSRKASPLTRGPRLRDILHRRTHSVANGV